MIDVFRQQSKPDRKDLSVRLFHRFAGDSARFDDDNLVSVAGLVPVMALAEQTA
jgi:hypothetical protein